MAQEQEFKIRVLPRTGEKSAAQGAASAPAKAKAKESQAGKGQRWIVYVGTLSVIALAAAFALPAGQKAEPSRQAAAHTPQPQPQKLDLSSVQDPVNAKISRHMQDALMKEEIMRQRLELENMRLKDPDLAESPAMLSSEDETRTYGVQLDQEDVAGKVYRDLNYRNTPSTEYLPEERINARLATRKWLNEHERAERINFVRNFIRSAYERGIEVEIDQNLVVVGAKKVTTPRKVDIDKIIDRMARQGQ